MSDTQEALFYGRHVTLRRTGETRMNDPLPEWLSRRQAARGNDYAKPEEARVILPPDESAGTVVWAPVRGGRVYGT